MSLKTFYSTIFSLSVFSLIVFAGCGGNAEAPKKSNAAATSSGVENTSGLSDFQLENGIGPVTEKLTLGEIDLAKASKGEKAFNEKCASCHKTSDERLVGPGWKGVTERRTPAWIMNFITNPDPMINKDPQLQAQL